MDSTCSCCSCNSSSIIEEEEQSPIPIISQPEKFKQKKLHAIQELQQTERDYVLDLSHLVQCLQILSRQQWITTRHKLIIKRNSIEILSFHQQFIIALNIESCIAQRFIDKMDQFLLYKHYCDMHAEAWALISEYRDRPEWTQFLKECAIHDTKQQRKLHFEDYLIKPVQRICRYQLLLKEIIRYTSPQCSEYELWKTISSEMQDIVTDIDYRKFQRDMKERTEKFVQRLDGDWRISKRHVSQLSNLLISGAIEVTYSALGQTVSKPRPKKVNCYEPKHWFPLRMTEFEDLLDIEGQREHSFVLRCKKHTFCFSASCAQEKILWVKKIQEAIISAKIEASDENLSAQDFIISSLPGITSKRSPQSIRLSRSFTNILDITLASGDLIDKRSHSDFSMNTLEKRNLKRSASTSIQFDDIIKLHTPVIKSTTSLKKRYSVDYSKSELYTKHDASFPSGLTATRKRPSSLDLLSAANNTTNMIGKMSLQLKSNHQNALRLTVDHKLRDVCTQDYLSSRAWYIRDRDSSPTSYYQSQTELSNSSNFTSVSRSNSTDLLKKHKSTSFIRSSASSFSLIIPKKSDKAKQQEYEIQSNTSSCSSSVDKSQLHLPASRRPSQSSQLMRRISQSRGIPESPISLDNTSSVNSFNVDKKIERCPSKKKLFVGKVLRRIASLHQKPPSPTSTNSSFAVKEIRKAASVDTKRNRTKWKKHEEMIQVDGNDRPEEEPPVITAFSYASTPPSKPKSSRWKTLIRPTSFLRNNNSMPSHIDL
ncbi:hypothetical protein MFLAVUS_005167 [Mucor flavus]|uniref:DH domain-containing protein n=1 Tax=Mucor flavus TaxID=439312 RepID=A0ABP9YXY4_9FUNG